MLNTEKIRLMHKTAVFEKKEKEYIEPAQDYFGRDYIGKHILSSFVLYTMCFVLVVMMQILYDIQTIINTSDIDNILVMLSGFIFQYLIGLVIYECITYKVYSYRYAKSIEIQNEHLSLLKQIKKRYELYERSLELNREGGDK